MPVFNPNPVDHSQEPMFFGAGTNVARYESPKYPIFDKLVEKQLGFFWRPEEVDLSKDRHDFNAMPSHEQRIFIANLQYQSLLDSVQGRAPALALLPLCSLSEMEGWITTWTFSETIHSRSYTHIMRNVFDNPVETMDQIVLTPEIMERAHAVTKYYDDLIDGIYAKADQRELKRRFYLCLVAINVLEAIRFYVSFACSFSFAERAVMEGNAKVIKLIARDEALHLAGTQHMLNILKSGEDDFEFLEIALECEEEVYQIFDLARSQERAWADYLFKDGSIIGLNSVLLGQYIDYITAVRMKAVGLTPRHSYPSSDPLPWMKPWLNSDNVQVAPQEAEISSYLVGQIDSSVEDNAFEDMTL
jgi:ribonucleoside-diphosphate reductase beta chain